ncbi:MAG: hypothetical protein NC427_16450 [Ruminococcus flavefaciens]|nr:hypothetical protein [Ruminococcus flavefaciens]
MKVEKIAMILGAVVIVFLAFAIVSEAGIIGISRSRLEEDARKEQNIDSSWGMVQDANEELCAMLFFDEDRDEYKYSVYLSGESLSYGYFLRDGGVYPFAEESVHGLVYEDKGIALLSPNEEGISRIVVDGETITVNQEKPFVVVLPIDCSEITLYDTQGNIVTLYDTYG